ncbi:mariner Mos1 transposase [Elysia marginata]|uniref:Mariner Mos1 transposase n=1 Tax=Elysia marginata TaxID=1093978 RepID=A0AAV4G5L3_9GAST|nr:mariner Mos1 transposase [Elysia marginata]
MAGIIQSSPAYQKFSRYDIRVIIKFSVILGKDASCIHKDLVTVLGENAPSIQTVLKWEKAVSEGRDDMEDEPRTTINAQYYKKVLQDKLRPAIGKKRPGLLESGILFHHDNAPVHTARAVTDVLAGYKWELLEHPRYSPELAPCVFIYSLK